MKKRINPAPCYKPLYNFSACLSCVRKKCPNDEYDKKKDNKKDKKC